MRHILKQAITFSCIALVLFFAFPGTSVKAGKRSITEVQQEINEKRAHIDELAGKIEKNKNNREAAEKLLKEFQAEYEVVCALIDEQEDIINTTEERLEEKGAELSATIEGIQHNKELYTERLQAIYTMSSTNVMMQTVFAVESFADAVAVTEGLQRISKRDTDLLDKLAAQQTEYETQKAELEGTIERLTEEMTQMQQNRDENEQKMQEMQQIISSANYQIKLSQQETAATEEDIKKLQAELAAIFAAQQAKGSQAGDDSTRYDGPLQWPVQGGGKLTGYFGDPRSNTGYHYGIDISASTGTPILAAASGKVITSTWHYSYGYYIVVDHGQGLRTLYAHCSELWAGEGASVEVGQAIAGVGNTGDSYGSHLHFEVHEHGQRQNPLGSGYLKT